MIMIMNSNTNDVGGRKFSPGGRNEPLKRPLSASTKNAYEEATNCALKWLSKITWQWAVEAKTWQIQMLALFLAFNVKTSNSMTNNQLAHFLTTAEPDPYEYGDHQSSICSLINQAANPFLIALINQS